MDIFRELLQIINDPLLEINSIKRQLSAREALSYSLPTGQLTRKTKEEAQERV